MGGREKNPVNTVLTGGWPVPPCSVPAMYHTAVCTPTDLKQFLASHIPKEERQVRKVYILKSCWKILPTSTHSTSLPLNPTACVLPRHIPSSLILIQRMPRS